MENFYLDTPELKFQLEHPLMDKITRLKENNFQYHLSFDYAPVDKDDALDNYDKVLEIVGEICANVIAPNAAEVDKEGAHLEEGHVRYARGTDQNYKALFDAGLIGMSLPREYEGLNFPIVPYVMAAEIVSRADASFANIWGLQDCAETIREFADEEQKQRYLPRFSREGATAAMVLTEPDAGSDLQAVQVKAHFDEASGVWKLNGVKRFITNGDADIALVLVRTEANTTDARGLSLFIYDKSSNAVTVRHLEHKLGIKGSPTTELVFKDAPAELLGQRKYGLIKYVMALMNSARLGIGAQSVGIADAAYREAVKYAKEREQFGHRIIEFPAVYEILRNIKARLDGIRALLYETTRYVDITKVYDEYSQNHTLEKEERNEMKFYSRYANVFTPLIKLFGSEYSNSIAYDSLQIHGGTGFTKDFPIERIYRDARITSIYEGTSQLQVIAAIKGVTTGIFQSRIQEFDEMLENDYSELRVKLQKLTSELNEAFTFIDEHKNTELLDFHSRRLVEMAGNIIISYILLLDSKRDKTYEDSARIFINLSLSENAAKYHYIMNFDNDLLITYKNIVI
ncbi:MAG: acyl-CoA dehydrogenase family protein [Saprospiraceae bacterium]|nr:acyl-CoA dehydrogenase family protein [Saprospiraceae bacterium]